MPAVCFIVSYNAGTYGLYTTDTSYLRCAGKHQQVAYCELFTKFDVNMLLLYTTGNFERLPRKRPSNVCVCVLVTHPDR